MKRRLTAERERVIRAEERERIRRSVLGCTDCGEIHRRRWEGPSSANPAGWTYRSPIDGHAYAARYIVTANGNSDKEAIDHLIGPASVQ